MPIASGASTSAASTRKVRLESERFSPAASDGSGPAKSGSRTRAQAAEATFAAVILRERTFEGSSIEIGPVQIEKHEFAVGGLPHQKVGQALLAAGANDEIGIGHVARGGFGRGHFLVDGTGRDVTARRFFGEHASGLGDFGARAVIEGNDE